MGEFARESFDRSGDAAAEVEVPARQAATMLRTAFMERALSAEFVGLTV